MQGRAWIAPAIAVLVAIGFAGSASSAGAAVVASNGFTSDANGYSFPNYGGGGETDLTTDRMRKLFGSRVCITGSEPCRLIPEAREWMDAMNTSMAGGHCYGMATTAQNFFEKIGRPKTPDPFGSPTVPGLEFDGNRDLQSYIAYAFSLQVIPSVVATKTQLTPNGVFRELRQTLKPGRSPDVLTIFDDGGGHAITPTAVETLGNDMKRIAVYDNNWPGQTRYVTIDGSEDSWSYQLAPNTTWSGTAKDDSLELMDSRPGLGHQPCYFCPAKGKPATGKRFEVRMTGEKKTGRHGSFEVRDRRGNKTGCGARGCRNEIPGAELREVASGAPSWRSNSPPVIDLPTSRSYEVLLGSTSKRGQVHEDVTVAGRGFTVGVADLAIRKGERDSIRIRRKLKRVTYENDARGTESPTITLTSSNSNTGKYFRAEVVPDGVNPGAGIVVGFDPLAGRIRLENRHGARVERATLELTIYTADGSHKRTVPLKLRRGQVKKATL